MLLVQIPEFNLCEFAGEVRRLRLLYDLVVREGLEVKTHNTHASDGTPLSFVLHPYFISVKNQTDEFITTSPEYAKIISLARPNPSALRYHTTAHIFDFKRCCAIIAILLMTDSEYTTVEVLQSLPTYNKLIKGVSNSILDTAYIVSSITPKLLAAEGSLLTKSADRNLIGLQLLDSLTDYVRHVLIKISGDSNVSLGYCGGYSLQRQDHVHS